MVKLAGLNAKRLVVGLALIGLGVGIGLCLGIGRPAGAQAPSTAEAPWVSDGSAPGFPGIMPPPIEIPQGSVMLNDQYVYVMMGRTLYQCRHGEFPSGMKQFTFKPEMPQPAPTVPYIPGAAPGIQ